MAEINYVRVNYLTLFNLYQKASAELDTVPPIPLPPGSAEPDHLVPSPTPKNAHSGLNTARDSVVSSGMERGLCALFRGCFIYLLFIIYYS